MKSCRYLGQLRGEERGEVFSLEHQRLPLLIGNNQGRQQKRCLVGCNWLTVAMVDERMQNRERLLRVWWASTPGLGAPFENLGVLTSSLSQKDHNPLSVRGVGRGKCLENAFQCCKVVERALACGSSIKHGLCIGGDDSGTIFSWFQNLTKLWLFNTIINVIYFITKRFEH